MKKKLVSVIGAVVLVMSMVVGIGIPAPAAGRRVLSYG